jgi:GT2 family glycosyltransferase
MLQIKSSNMVNVNNNYNYISIVIVTWNGKHYIGTLFNSLSRILNRHPNIEIIIVDNGSTDGTQDIVKTIIERLNLNSRVTLKCLNKNLGFMGGNNVGIMFATGKLIFMLNQDTYLHDEALENVFQIFNSDPKIGATQCLLLQYRHPRILDSCGDEFSSLGTGIIGCFGERFTKVLAEINERREIVLARGAALIIKREVLELSKKIFGTYLPTYLVAPYYEDWFLSIFTRVLGYKILLIPSCIVYHDSLKQIHRDPYTLYNAVNIFVQFRAPIFMILGTIGTIAFSSIFISKQPLKLLICFRALLRKLRKNIQMRYYIDILAKQRGIELKNLWKTKRKTTDALRWYFTFLQLTRK